MAKSIEQMQQELNAYHGSPHRFPPTANNPLGEFDASKIGTGEGAQAYGHGHYLAENPAVSNEYATKLSSPIINFGSNNKLSAESEKAAKWIRDNVGVMQSNARQGEANRLFNLLPVNIQNELGKPSLPNVGNLYKVDLPDEQIAKMLDWDKPLSQQSWYRPVADVVKEYKGAGKDVDAYAKLISKANARGGEVTGGQLYEGMLSQFGGDQAKVSEFMRKAGIPGIKYLDQGSRAGGEGTRNFVIFPGNEHMMKIVHREADGGSIHDGNSVRVTHMADGGQPFYSAADKAIQAIKQPKGTGEQYRGMLLNAGVKPQEMADRKLDKLSGKMTQADLIQHAHANPMPNITVKTLHGKGPDSGNYRVEYDPNSQRWEVMDDYSMPVARFDSDDEANEHAAKMNESGTAKYEDYTSPGGKNYKEMLFRMPSDVPGKESAMRSWHEQMKQKYKTIGWKELATTEEVSKNNALVAALKKDQNAFKSQHYDELNILAHARVSDRIGPNGEKQLHVEEMQSDWHQKARDARKNEIKRLVKNGMTEDDAKKAVPSDFGYSGNIKELPDNYNLEEFVQASGARAFRVLDPQGKLYSSGMSPESATRNAIANLNVGVPDAPFKKDWHEMVMKHLLDHAVRNGYDQVVFTPGAEQAKRYPNPNKIAEENLRAMSGFYDKILPTFLNKYGAKHGMKMRLHDTPIDGKKYRVYKDNDPKPWSVVPQNGFTIASRHDTQEDAEKAAADLATKPLHSIDITPQFKQHVLTNGQQLYKSGGDVKPTKAQMQWEMLHKAKGGGVKQMGINVTSDKVAGRRYADLIVDGHKTLESRNSDSLRPYVGKRISIVRTGEGQAKAIGEVTIGEPMVVDKKKFRSLESQHHVPEGSKFDITTPTKHLYPMHDPIRYDKERDVGHGIVSRQVIGKAKGGSIKEPKSTVPAYKLFRVDKKQPGKLFPLFVDSKTPVERDKWVEAKAGEMAGEKVKSKIGPLAYRPGWHAGDLPVATHIGEKSDPSLNKPDRRPSNHVWAEVDMPNDVDWQSEANKRGTTAKGLVPVKAHITDQVPKGGHYRYKTNPNMTGDWLIGGSMKVKRVLTDAEVKKINKKAGTSDLPRDKPIKLKDYGFKGGGGITQSGMQFEMLRKKKV